MNPEMDGTAIWLERKFDMPASGQWISEAIFSIPLADNRASSYSPGLIVFERTPLEGISDAIDRYFYPLVYILLRTYLLLTRKYRVLDDCSRLRDIVGTLPSRRHFVPSLLIITWVDSKSNDTAVDFNTMVAKLVEDGIVSSHQDFAITVENKDLDATLKEALSTMVIDTEGQLVQLLSAQGSNISYFGTASLFDIPVLGIFKSFEPTWLDFLSEWTGSYLANGECEDTL